MTNSVPFPPSFFRFRVTEGFFSQSIQIECLLQGIRTFLWVPQHNEHFKDSVMIWSNLLSHMSILFENGLSCSTFATSSIQHYPLQQAVEGAGKGIRIHSVVLPRRAVWITVVRAACKASYQLPDGWSDVGAAEQWERESKHFNLHLLELCSVVAVKWWK